MAVGKGLNPKRPHPTVTCKKKTNAPHPVRTRRPSSPTPPPPNSPAWSSAALSPARSAAAQLPYAAPRPSPLRHTPLPRAPLLSPAQYGESSSSCPIRRAAAPRPGVGTGHRTALRADPVPAVSYHVSAPLPASVRGVVLCRGCSGVDLGLSS